MPYFFFYILFIPLLVSANERKRRQMKPRVLLEPEAFLQLVKAEKNRVIRTAKLMFQGHMHVVECDSYFYYAFSKEPLAMPDGIEVIDAKFFAF